VGDEGFRNGFSRLYEFRIFFFFCLRCCDWFYFVCAFGNVNCNIGRNCGHAKL